MHACIHATHAHTQTCLDAHMPMQTCICARAYICAQTRKYACHMRATCAHEHAHMHVITCTCTCSTRHTGKWVAVAVRVGARRCCRSFSTSRRSASSASPLSACARTRCELYVSCMDLMMASAPESCSCSARSRCDCASTASTDRTGALLSEPLTSRLTTSLAGSNLSATRNASCSEAILSS